MAAVLETFRLSAVPSIGTAGFKRLSQDLAAGTFRKRVRAAALSSGPSTSFGEAAFSHYFGATPESLATEYHDHLVRVCGF